jgi:serine/threonine-protein kinase
LADAVKQQRPSRWRTFAAASTVIALTAVGASSYTVVNDTAPKQGPPAASPTLAQPQRAAEYAPPPAAPSQQLAPSPNGAPPPASPTPASVQAAPAPQRPPPVPQQPAPAPQQPKPGPDQTYLSLVSEIPGVTVTDPTTAATTGRGVCTHLQNGGSPTDVTAATVNSNGGLTPAQAAAGVNAAITAYCPQYAR